MKLFYILLACTLASCVTDRNILTNIEKSEWQSQHDTIFHKGIPVAVFTHFEYELYKGDQSIELCLSQINDTLNDIDGLIKYVHTVHSKEKVQIRAMYPNTMFNSKP